METLNNSEAKLKDLIHVEKNIIPDNICDYVIKDIESREWRPHTWYNSQSNTISNELSMELDVQNTTEDLQKLLSPYIVEAGYFYNQKYHYKSDRTNQIINKFSKLRFNRYSPGQIMRQHYDHIHSLYDGKEKGIPVLSFILNLNDDYEGANLYFWKDYIVPLGKGDIIMFPSLFLFPHGVTEASKGCRYSAVSWAW